MNVWAFSGNLGRDAEQRFLANGNSVVDFSVAVKSGYGDKAAVTWPKCTVWGKHGEALLPYLKKGQLVGISGEVTLREYAKRDGTNGASLEVRVNDVTLLGKRHDSAREQSPVTEHSAAKANAFVDDIDGAPF